MFFDHPLWGIGLDNFQFYLPAYMPQAYSSLGVVLYEAMANTKWSHNEILQLLSEGGIIALFLVVVFFYKSFKKFREIWVVLLP